MAKTRTKAAKEHAPHERTVKEVHSEHEQRVAEATSETREHIEENEKMHAKAQARGAHAEPHVQKIEQEGMTLSDHRVEGATVINENPNKDYVDVGQEAKSIGMGPLMISKGLKGSAQQPPSKTRSAYTVSATADLAGRAYNFGHVGSGTDVGAQAAKTSGAQVLAGGGPHGAINPTILSDVPAVDAPLPTYSDRLANDPDMPGVVGGVTPSGANNLPRMHAPETVMADRRLAPGETADHPRANVLTKTPNDPGGRELGMGPTKFHLGAAEPVGVDAPPVKPKARVKTKGENVSLKQTKVEPAKVRATSKAAKKIKAGGGDPTVTDQENTAEREERKRETETKEVKSTPTTEQKDAPIETGSTGNEE